MSASRGDFLAGPRRGSLAGLASSQSNPRLSEEAGSGSRSPLGVGSRVPARSGHVLPRPSIERQRPSSDSIGNNNPTGNNNESSHTVGSIIEDGGEHGIARLAVTQRQVRRDTVRNLNLTLDLELARSRDAASALWDNAAQPAVYEEPLDEDDAAGPPTALPLEQPIPPEASQSHEGLFVAATSDARASRNSSSTLSAAIKSAAEPPKPPTPVAPAIGGLSSARGGRTRQFAKHKKLGSPRPEPAPEMAVEDEPAQKSTTTNEEAPTKPAEPSVVTPQSEHPQPESGVTVTRTGPTPPMPDPREAAYDEVFDDDTAASAGPSMPASTNQSPSKRPPYFRDVPEQSDLTPLLSYGFNGELGMPARTPTYQTFKNLGNNGQPEEEEASCWSACMAAGLRTRSSVERVRQVGHGDTEPGVSLRDKMLGVFTLKNLVLDPASYLPAVFLGLMMNVLDSLSYGIVVFPNSPIFPASAPSAGISIFFITTIISQLTYSLGLSRFRGANGSMMIEVIPFLHAMCASVITTVTPLAHDDENQTRRRKMILATVMVCYVLSTLLTGIAFLLLGVFKLGNLMSFLPRHLLIATIGGIGIFLVLTGIEVTTEVAFTVSLDYLKAIFVPTKLMLWGTSAAIAIVLQFLSRKIRHPLFVPFFFMLVPATFYGIVFSLRIPLDELRKNGWLFDLAQPGSDQSSPFEFYSYFSLVNTRWDAVLACLPTILAVSFFGVLHVPINIPALSVSTGTEVDTNNELIAHGVSNMLSGFVGSIQNYLVYSNSLLFIRSGGDSRLAGVMLAAATMACFFGGTWLVDFVPVIVVGALIFHLGFDLVRESLVDTVPIVSKFEYITVVIVAISMPIWGFTEGIILGIMAACLFFVIQSSRRSIVRAKYSGRQMWSPVHRLYRQQMFLEKVGDQIRVYRLQGQIFFGTVGQLEAIANEVRNDRNLRCLVMDFALTTALDYTAAEAFTKLRHALAEKHAYLCLSGISPESPILEALDRVGMLEEDVKIFDTLDSALEFCENLLLEAFFRHQARLTRAEPQQQAQPLQAQRLRPPTHGGSTGVDLLGTTLRTGQLSQALEHAFTGLSVPTASAHEPYNLLCNVLNEPCNGDTERLEQVVESVYSKFKRIERGPGTILWRANSEADGLFVVESGQLSMLGQALAGGSAGQRPEGATAEILLAGTMVGQLETFAGRPRLATLVVDEESVLWHLSKSDIEALVKEKPADALTFTQYSLSFVHQLLNESLNHRVRYE